jgi:hypothetical protein
MRFTLQGCAVMRRFSAVMLAAGLAFAMPAWADDAQEFEAACLKMACQHDLHVEMRRKDGTAYSETFKLFPPTVQGAGFSVVAGQTIYIEAEVDGNLLTKLTAVDKILVPEKTITARLKQVDGKGMTLVVTNPFSRPLKFNMGMMPLDTDSLRKTSSCPVRPGASSYEMWPFPIFQMVLANARLLEPDANPGCGN